MENGQHADAVGSDHRFIMNSLDQKEQPQNHNDIVARRLKNRERQRRYRARKRLEADMKKTSARDQLTTPQVALEPNGNHNSYSTRVHCKRDWKKDARRAHVCENLDNTHSGVVISPMAFHAESQAICLASGISGEQPIGRNSHSENSHSMPNGATHENKGRRDWKAEARNKKN